MKDSRNENIRFRGEEDEMVHAPASSSLVLCRPNLVGASVKRTADPVTCMECILLER